LAEKIIEIDIEIEIFQHQLIEIEIDLKFYNRTITINCVRCWRKCTVVVETVTFTSSTCHHECTLHSHRVLRGCETTNVIIANRLQELWWSCWQTLTSVES